MMAPWTYSALTAYESCPKRFYHTRVARDFVDAPNEANLWGNRVHKAFEDRINSGTPLQAEYAHWEPMAAKIAALPGTKHPEMKFAVDDAYKKSEWKGSWSRGIADLVVLQDNTAAVLDYKTGARRPSDQLRLYAAYLFSYRPVLESVTTAFVWLKDRKVDKEIVQKAEVSPIWLSFSQRVHKLEEAHAQGSWPARPNGLCKKHCPVRTCEFHGG